jgi:hypothetical protein
MAHQVAMTPFQSDRDGAGVELGGCSAPASRDPAFTALVTASC